MSRMRKNLMNRMNKSNTIKMINQFLASTLSPPHLQTLHVLPDLSFMWPFMPHPVPHEFLILQCPWLVYP